MRLQSIRRIRACHVTIALESDCYIQRLARFHSMHPDGLFHQHLLDLVGDLLIGGRFDAVEADLVGDAFNLS